MHLSTLRDRCARALHALRGRLRRRARAPLELVAYRPLHGGGMLYVADVDQRRLVFVTAPHTACLLAAYRVPRPPRREEEEDASSRV